MEQQKFLIIGAGIAGISISKALVSEGHSVKMIDDGKNRSSIVAAGMINPIVFRRMTKSWRIDAFLPFAKEFYATLGEKCGHQFMHSITIRRLFSSEQERDFWLSKQELEEFCAYLTKLSSDDLTYAKATNLFGSGRVKNSAFIATHSFLEESKKWLSTVLDLVNEEVDYTKLDPETGEYKEESFDGIIFCEGVEVRNNPWFGAIPINPTKGEILTITSETLPENESLNRKCFVLPSGNKTFKIGSTYVWNTCNDTTTAEGRKEICDHLSYLTSAPYTITEQTAGIRPTTLDRRPIMGRHETFPKLIVYNGLGAKGYLLAPLLGKELADHLLHSIPLDKEIRYSRLKK